MHIGLVIYGDLDVISGGYLYDKQLVSYWRSQGHKVTIFSLPWRNYWRHFEDNLSRRWIKQLLSSNIDILVQDELNHPSLIGINQSLKRKGSFPLVSIIHLLRCSEPYSFWPKNFYRSIERRYLKQMDGFIFNSYDTMRQVKILTNSLTPGIMAYPGNDHWSLNLTDEDIIARASISDPIRILYVGNYIMRKGLHVLLSGLSAIDSKDWQLTAIGRRDLEPEYVKKVERFIQSRKLGGQVKLMGSVAPEKMAVHFKTHQLFIMLSLYEPFGIVYLEAMGAGLPVIASTAGAGQELIQNGSNGYLISLPNSNDLAELVRNLHQDRDLLAQMGIRAQKRYNKHPTWAETGAKVTAFLEEIINK